MEIESMRIQSLPTTAYIRDAFIVERFMFCHMIFSYLQITNNLHTPLTTATNTTRQMGRNKGKQCGEFDRKCQNAHHRHTVYVDRASEANRYRNPMQIGSGQGYRNDAPCNNLEFFNIQKSIQYQNQNVKLPVVPSEVSRSLVCHLVDRWVVIIT